MRRGRWYAPWWLLTLLDRFNVWCWADLVQWKMFRTGWAQRNTRCVKVIEDGSCRLTCYCGFWDNPAVSPSRRSTRQENEGT